VMEMVRPAAPVSAARPMRIQTKPVSRWQPVPVQGEIQRCGGIRCPPGTCGHEENEKIHRLAQGQPQPTRIPPSVFGVLRTAGRPLDTSLRADMEKRFGHDFAHVRVHADPSAARSARAIQAQAYTVGRHVVMGQNQFQPHTAPGMRLLAHELGHVVQQGNPVGDIAPPHAISHHDDPSEMQADRMAAAAQRMVFGAGLYNPKAIAAPKILANELVPTPASTSTSVMRQTLNPDPPPPPIERNIELRPHLIPLNAHAEREAGKCEEFPGGSTDCEIDEKRGALTGKVTQRIDEKNPCTRPCVQQHEAVHVEQLKKYCPQLRDCYLAADKGTRSPSDCLKLATTGIKERECAAYNVSVPCVEKRLKTAKECQTAENKEYGARKLASEKCFQEHDCAGAAGK